MNTGMLWFDNDPDRSVAAKIQRAAAHYTTKYRRSPSLCFIHPSTLGASGVPQTPMDKILADCGMEVRTAPWMLPNHYWIGEKEET